MSYVRASGNRKNANYANKGRAFEELIELTNKQYERKGIALVQKVSTPWQVIRRGKQIVSAFPQGKSTLDFRGTVREGISISFDCKESADERGLPLAHIQEHQIEYMRTALGVGEVSFILANVKPLDKYFMIHGNVIITYWDRWQVNKGKRGYNYIPTESMMEIKGSRGIALDYLQKLDVGGEYGAILDE